VKNTKYIATFIVLFYSIFNYSQVKKDTTALQQVIVKTQKSNVEIKLDKKIYNVGQDITAKGGTATDVLNNVPSVTVDSDGNVSLRGNDAVKILIDGRPSNAVNIANALQNIPADALDKIEVISNPSSRYDAEGGAGIINIILKKGKNDGINGSVLATVGDPKNYGLSGNINFKSDKANIYSTIGYYDLEFQGKTNINSDYLNPDGTLKNTINERIVRTRAKKGYNYNLGIDLYLPKSWTWTNGMNFSKNDGGAPETDLLYTYLPSGNFVRNRSNNQIIVENDASYNTSFTKKFKKDGHKLTLNGNFSQGVENNNSVISDFVIGQESKTAKTTTKNNQLQNRNLFQVDYVLPLGKEGQFEAGYKIDYNTVFSDYNVINIDEFGNFIPKLNFTNQFQYSEKINAVYSQFGSKTGKLSYLFGLRFEKSEIGINLLTTQNFNSKNYNNLFPSAFLTYAVSDETNISLNYSRRITRPRNRFLNPFAGYTSNVNLFQGNPDINPAMTDAIDFGFLTKINKITLTTSLYYNYNKNLFQFIRRPNGDDVKTEVNGATIITPVILFTPINLDHENRFGFEFTLNYSPYKWWKLNSNFNFFQSNIVGDNVYTLLKTKETVTQNLSKNSSSWFAKINSRMTLPYKIEWQTNAIYTAPQNTGQGESLGVLSANLAFSKDVMKDKATISLNVNDIFNSAKMIRRFNLAEVNSYSEMQRKVRQINLSFTYRFNKKKTEREKPARNEGDGGGDF
jgi:outer membrane receptor for ferrienterochelin and colicins